jgi:hypothetical protein
MNNDEKQFYVKVVLDWGISISAENKEKAVELVKAIYLQNHDIELRDEEIKELVEQ